jgi:hypothetical protein
MEITPRKLTPLQCTIQWLSIYLQSKPSLLSSFRTINCMIPKRNTVCVSSQSLLPPPHPQGDANTLSVYTDRPAVDILYEWLTHCVVFCDSLIWPCMMFRGGGCWSMWWHISICHSFLWLLIFSCMNEPHFLYPSICWWTFGVFSLFFPLFWWCWSLKSGPCIC